MDSRKLLGEIRHRIRRSLDVTSRPGRSLPARLGPAEWWDHLYSTCSPYSAVGNPAFDEADNCEQHQARWEFVTGVLGPEISLAGKHVLEPGCGPGMFTKRLLEAGARVTAFDISSVAVERWGDIVGPTSRAVVQRTTVQDFCSPDRFDLVLCLGVLVSIREDEAHERAFRNMASHLRRDGHLLVEELLAGADRTGSDHPQLNFRTVEDYRSLAARAAMRIVRHASRPGRTPDLDWHALLFAPGE